jgi:ppGpp synthetase/RelA/SpoT-type nucleotidyltranferase
MADSAPHEELLVEYDRLSHDFRIFMNGVVDYIGNHPELRKPDHEIVHSYKSRLKDRQHLRDKISRKIAKGREITVANFFDEITDFAGVRILHLFQEDFANIDSIVRQRLSGGDWVLAERPRAYTWDPETVEFFKNFDLEVSEKPSSYTSVHYVVRPRKDSKISCEIQVRTLFEEIWGEVDHQINYPEPTQDLACREQIKVLSKIIGAGSRLLDSLRRVHNATRAAP